MSKPERTPCYMLTGARLGHLSEPILMIVCSR